MRIDDSMRITSDQNKTLVSLSISRAVLDSETNNFLFGRLNWIPNLYIRGVAQLEPTQFVSNIFRLVDSPVVLDLPLGPLGK